MAQAKTGIYRWSNVRGVNYSMNPDFLADGLVTESSNVELLPGAIGRRRPALSDFSTTGVSEPIYRLFRFIAADGVDSIWIASSGATEDLDFRKSGATTSVTFGDAPATDGMETAAFAQLNQKLYVAYNSSVNRLHLYDGTVFRRVGLSKPSAPTVADTGAGAYAATARRYRVSFRIKSGSDVVVESELSDAVAFTPSGAGTAARVTKPTTVDSATHWVVWGLISTAGDTYDLYKELSEIVVGTTTYDDSTNPSAYAGDAPAQLGLHIPPPSCRLLLATDNRVFMAGAWESSASAGDTVPKTSRVWFTRVLGSSDNGDDETIPNTTTQKNWIDVGEGDGDSISALAGPIDGTIYVFKTRSIWQLTPTGELTIPYVAERITSAVGAYRNALTGAFSTAVTLVAEDTVGQPAVYFAEDEAIYRISPRSGIERINEDLTPALDGRTFVYKDAVFWPRRRQLMFAGSVSSNAAILVYTPRLAFRDELGTLRGGWSVYSGGFSGAVEAACLTTVSSSVVPLFGGRTILSVPQASTFSADNSVQQDTSPGPANIVASITSAPIRPGQQGYHKNTLGNPIIDASVTSSATPTLSYVRDYGTETRSATVPSLSAAGSETRVFRKVEELTMADARTVQVTYAWDSDQYGASELTGSILIPYTVQEPL